MTLETTPASTGVEGNFRVKWVDAIAGAAITAAEFEGGDDLTYSLTPDGWQPAQDQATAVDDRLTLAQALERPGKKTKSLTLKYIHGSTADTTLVEGTAGYIVARPITPNATAGTAAQKVVVWPALCGEQVQDAPVSNGVFTKTSKIFVTGAVAYHTVAA